MYDVPDDLEESQNVKVPSYKNLRLYNDILEVTVPRSTFLAEITSKIKEDKYITGYNVILQTPLSSVPLEGLYDLDLTKLDEFITALKNQELMLK